MTGNEMMNVEEDVQLLVIEDNVGDYVLVEEFLQDEFHNPQITRASRFAEAKEKLKEKKEHYDAILLDLTLPDLSGEELVDAMLGIADNIPVIVLTGYTDLSFSIKSLAKGVSDYLLKDELTPVLLKKSILYGIERNEYAAKVRRSEKNYRNLFELSPLPMWLFDMETLRFLDVNNATEQLYGYSKEEFMNMTIRDIRPESAQAELDESLELSRKNPGLKYIGVNTHRKKSGELMKIEIQSSTIEYEGSDARLILAMDITEKLKEEERLKLLESVITHSDEAVIILEAEPTDAEARKILYVNEAFTKNTGYTPDEVLGETLFILTGEKTDPSKVRQLRRAMNRWENLNVEFMNYRKDGSAFWTNTSLVPVADKEGGYSHWALISRDITKRKEYETELKESLKEKEVLLSEIHHRVKNNLAVVSGMIQLQAFEEKDPKVEKKLTDSIFRIHTMASIHELLYQSGSFSKLMFPEIVNKLVQKVQGILADDREITVDIQKTTVQLNINQAIPASLVMNEVITNIYKHAFKDRKKGKVGIKISESENRVKIRIEDDGVGLPDEDESSGSLGLHIIEILSNQLQGTKKLYNTGSGTAFELEFEKSDTMGAGSALID